MSWRPVPGIFLQIQVVRRDKPTDGQTLLSTLELSEKTQTYSGHVRTFWISLAANPPGKTWLLSMDLMDLADLLQAPQSKNFFSAEVGSQLPPSLPTCH
jgi:hypothetical protein